jgi:hypothetical protein
MVAKISLERDKISITGMEISPCKHLQAGWSRCWDKSSKMQRRAIINNCQNNVKTTKLSMQAG